MNRSQKPQKKVAPKKVAKKPLKVAKRKLSTKKVMAVKAAPVQKINFMSRRAMSGVNGQIFFTEDHEYMRFDSDKTAFVGISNHAQELLGEIVYVETPSVGSVFAKKDPIGSIESVKSSNNVYAPANFTVLKANQAIVDNPALVNEDPEQAGWIAHVEVEDSTQVAKLMNKEQYEVFCANAV